MAEQVTSSTPDEPSTSSPAAPSSINVTGSPAQHTFTVAPSAEPPLQLLADADSLECLKEPTPPRSQRSIPQYSTAAYRRRKEKEEQYRQDRVYYRRKHDEYVRKAQDYEDEARYYRNRARRLRREYKL